MSDKPKIIGIHNRGPGSLFVSFPDAPLDVAEILAHDSLSAMPGVNLRDAVIYTQQGQTCDVEYTTAAD